MQITGQFIQLVYLIKFIWKKGDEHPMAFQSFGKEGKKKGHYRKRSRKMSGNGWPMCILSFFCGNNNTWPLVIHGLECCQWRNFQIRKDQKLLWIRLNFSLNDINIAIYLLNENLWFLFDLRLTCCWHVSVFFMSLANSALLHHTNTQKHVLSESSLRA